ncbi:YecA family protein [Rhodobacteraceae bacterium]|nr:YecA family protein [Paracoccaceae bacterium]
MDERRVHRWAEQWASRIAADLEAVTGLLAEMSPDVPDDLLVLFTGVLDGIRMNLENDEKDADLIFACIDSWISTVASGFERAQKMALCQAFIRAESQPPDAIRVGVDDDELPEEMGGLDAPDIEALVLDLIPEDVAGYSAYMILREATGAMPQDAAMAFVHQMIIQAVPKMVTMGRYFLLDAQEGMRGAAAVGFVDLAHAGEIDAARLADLIRLRKWLPNSEARQKLDHAIKEALRREACGGSIQKPWRLHRLMSSLPDGTGSQSIVASVSRGTEKCVAMLMLKAGHGIKDAYAIPCPSATGQREMLAEIESGVELYEVPPGYLPAALSQALGETLPPAPGFIDVSEMLGQADITPAQPATSIDIADPDGTVTTLSAQRRGRLIGQSLSWAGEFDMAQSWFVTNATLSDALAAARTERQAEKAIWEVLEAQRSEWSMLFARAAAVLRNADDPEWHAFAAVVQGLETGRALKKIPIFEMIAALTLDVAEQEGFDPMEDEAVFDHDIVPEGKGELARLLEGTPLTPDGIDGYLTGILVAPEFTTPPDWLPPLLGEINFVGEGSVQRVLDILMLRYGVIQDALFDGDFANALRKRGVRQFTCWLEGFVQASALLQAWPKSALSADDRKILRLIRDGVEEPDIQATLKPLLPAWLQQKAARAMG